MGIPLWRRVIDIVAWVFCALAAAGFTAHVLTDRQTGDRLFSAAIAAVLGVMLWRAAPVVLRRQR